MVESTAVMNGDWIAPRLIVSALGNSQAASLSGLGLCVGLRSAKTSVCACVLGLNLAQALIYRGLTGREVRAIDGRLQSLQQVEDALWLASRGADLVLIEGEADGEPQHPSGLATLDVLVARQMGSPILLVVTPEAIDSTLASLAHLNSESPPAPVAGVVVWGVPDADPRVTALQTALAEQGVPLIGAVPAMVESVVVANRFVDFRLREGVLPQRLLVELGGLLTSYLDVELLLSRARDLSRTLSLSFEHAPRPKRCRIAVSRDGCFNGSVQDNLEWLRYYGAELAPFSPLADSRLPRGTSAVYLCGGQLGRYATDLADNKMLWEELRKLVKAGGVLFTEADSTALMCREFTVRNEPNKRLEGAGLLPAHAVEQPALFPVYQELTLLEESILGPEGLQCRGVSPGAWNIESPVSLLCCMQARTGITHSTADGFSPSAQAVCNLALCHFGSNPLFASYLVDAAEVAHRVFERKATR